MCEEIDYYRRRELQERRSAMRTMDPAIAAIHRFMANHYTDLLRQLVTTDPAGPSEPEDVGDIRAVTRIVVPE